MIHAMLVCGVFDVACSEDVLTYILLQQIMSAGGSTAARDTVVPRSAGIDNWRLHRSDRVPFFSLGERFVETNPSWDTSFMLANLRGLASVALVPGSMILIW